MKKCLPILIMTLCISCNSPESHEIKLDQPFSKKLWSMKSGKDYLFREFVLDDLIKTDTLRNLSKKEVITLLGSPDVDRNNEDYLYYTISQKRLLSWPLHTRSLVIKFKNPQKVDWIKVHE